LVDVSHDVITRADDCGTTEGILIVKDEVGRTAAFADRLVGRYASRKDSFWEKQKRNC